jgi:hypothetical protein
MDDGGTSRMSLAAFKIALLIEKWVQQNAFALTVFTAAPGQNKNTASTALYRRKIAGPISTPVHIE